MEDKDTLKWTVELQEDPATGDAILEFPPDFLAKTGWVEGDTLTWRELGDGAWTLEKTQSTNNADTTVQDQI
jgi:hypothetical protein